MKNIFSAIALVLCLCITILPLQGCLSQTSLAALTQTLGTATASIETIEGNTAAATEIATATQAAVAAITAWKNGTPAQDVLNAITILQNDINLLPVSTQDQALIDLSLATIESIVTIVQAQTPQSPTVHAVLLRHPHLKKIPGSQKDFTKQWNALSLAHPVQQLHTQAFNGNNIQGIADNSNNELCIFVTTYPGHVVCK